MKRFKKASDIKVGVIGYGGAFNMGKAHLDLMKQAGMTPVAVMDVDKTRVEQAGKDFPGIETYTSLTAMLSKSSVNFVVIITPHNTHAKIALQCLNAGKHVCSEKPLAITTEECDKMIAAAKKNGLVLTTFHNRHWDGWIIEAVRQIVREKRIGDVVRVEGHMGGYGKPGDWWRSSKTISGGILYDWGVHILEYSLQLIDSEMVEVFGTAHNGFWASQTKWGKDTNEDEAKAIVRFKNGSWLSLQSSSIDLNSPEGFLTVTGTKGKYVMGGGLGYKIWYMQDGQKRYEEGPNPPGQYEKYYGNVADHLVKGTELVITPEWSRRPIHILDLANKSAKAGKAIKAKYA
ncbi:MAG: Gfo/Idh/MocA family oxidoreductase [Planctomycetaceae bacterium]|nr:Gfo/Idh/MocA family oxidoreductase [Planctomycetaceae bacterium]